MQGHAQHSPCCHSDPGSAGEESRWARRIRRPAQEILRCALDDKPRDSAFTLVEILMVLALMALAATVLIPAAGALFHRQGSGDVTDIMADVLQQARREAVLTGREVVMHFDAPAQ